jgi:hypothetical protein
VPPPVPLIRLIEARFGVTEPNISSQINIPWSNGSLLRLIGP